MKVMVVCVSIYESKDLRKSMHKFLASVLSIKLTIANTYRIHHFFR